MELIKKAQKIIFKHENSVVYDRIFYDVKEIDDRKVEMKAFIDGGQQISCDFCVSEEEILSFIENTRI